jgi:hypothetical protein
MGPSTTRNLSRAKDYTSLGMTGNEDKDGEDEDNVPPNFPDVPPNLPVPGLGPAYMKA